MVPWMLHDVALPLAQRYPRDAWELLLGYDQQRRMSARAGAATAREASIADGIPPVAADEGASHCIPG
jgi:hypothetical protein